MTMMKRKEIIMIIFSQTAENRVKERKRNIIKEVDEWIVQFIKS